MNLLEVRTQFIKLCGRYDLVDASFADTGADYFIKAGLKTLDRMVEFDKDVVKLRTAVVIGDANVSVPLQRVINRVWFEDSSGSKRELDYEAPADMDLLYPDGVATPNATTCYFTMSIDTDQLTASAIIIMPPTDEAGTVEIWAKRETPFPTLEAGTNYWFDRFEHIAVQAALYQLELAYRNTAGQRDILAGIQMMLHGIEKDTVEDDADRTGEMEG